MSVSYENSKVIFQGIKAAGITSLSALPETWLGLLLQQAEKDPAVTMVQVAKEEEAPAKVVNLMEALRKSLDPVSENKKKPAKADLSKLQEAKAAAPRKRARA